MVAIDQANPHLAAVRAAARAVSSAGHGSEGGELERARFALFAAIQAEDPDPEQARAWLNALETAALACRSAISDDRVLGGPSGIGQRLEIAVRGLRSVVEGLA